MSSKTSLRRSARTTSTSSIPKNSTMKPTSNKKPGESNPIIMHAQSKQTTASPPTTSKSADVLSDVDEDSYLTSRTRSNSNTSSVSVISEQPDPQFKYSIQNIPARLATQKKFFTILTTHLLIKNIEILKVNFNKSALLITGSELPPSFQALLQTACSDAAITIGPINRRTKPQTNPKKSPHFSLVIHDVDIDIEERDVLNHALSLNLKIHKMWRIVKKKNNKPTPLIRIISDHAPKIDLFLTIGINLFGRHHQCEPSNPPPPTPVQCPKCFTLGHNTSKCPKKPICPTCPDSHAPNK
ncbi:hypothetical protein Zmor_021389 [Zophobas morio]|uniref:Gag-like protein n=1 Tax=Zophobas morio TaxID=2755281 RepID=A0AA38I8J3_9CUCU|nr:hypothetical protein Zmor_021389 [Zophobas morio]